MTTDPGYGYQDPPALPPAPSLPFAAEPRSRMRILGWTLVGLLPVSALIVFVVLHAMAASAAAATGGCGGG